MCGNGTLGCPGGTLGYFAPATFQSFVDIAPPEVFQTPEQSEASQVYREGMTQLVRQAGRPVPPPMHPNVVLLHGLGQWERNPGVLAYQESMRELDVLDPLMAEQAALQAAVMGRQADLRWGAHEALRIHTPPHAVHGPVGQIWVTPSAPPGASWQERASIGVPIRYLNPFPGPIL